MTNKQTIRQLREIAETYRRNALSIECADNTTNGERISRDLKTKASAAERAARMLDATDMREAT